MARPLERRPQQQCYSHSEGSVEIKGGIKEGKYNMLGTAEDLSCRTALTLVYSRQKSRVHQSEPIREESTLSKTLLLCCIFKFNTTVDGPWPTSTLALFEANVKRYFKRVKPTMHCRVYIWVLIFHTWCPHKI